MNFSRSLNNSYQITGLITDPNGAAVPDASVSARNVDTDIRTEATTNSQGYYTLPGLNPGTYDLSVTKTGFRTTTRSAIKIDVAQIARIDLALSVGEVRESITVSAEAPMLVSETATIAQVITSQKPSISP